MYTESKKKFAGTTYSNQFFPKIISASHHQYKSLTHFSLETPNG